MTRVGVTIEKFKMQLKVTDELWEKFKAQVPKTKTLNQAVVELIKKFVEESR